MPVNGLGQKIGLVILIFSSIRLIPHIILFLFVDKNGFLKKDVARWAEITRLTKRQSKFQTLIAFIRLMTFLPEFRNLFYYRCGLKSKIFLFLCPRKSSLYIGANYIGPGLFIQHGDCCLVQADMIGSDCWINQQVTIGYSTPVVSRLPIIGNNVRIAAGAKVLGDVRIGDNSVIGPNTVVIEDVPPNVTLIGVPGKIIWRTNATNSSAKPPNSAPEKLLAQKQ
ncbi:MAG TPA: serine acetyltransferase [Methylocella sp.]|nr:serine acetyltransferase [Methylocella sp.]